MLVTASFLRKRCPLASVRLLPLGLDLVLSDVIADTSGMGLHTSKREHLFAGL